MLNQTNNIKDELFEKYGYLIGGSDLTKVMGYRSSAAFYRAATLNIVGVKVFSIQDRKGKFALTVDVANWLENIINSNNQ
jgi:hypothetical protein